MTALILALLPLSLPLYAVRFRIGPLPTTLLEILILATLVAWTMTRKLTGWKDAVKILGRQGWLIPLGLWLLAGAIGIIVAPDHFAALGLWRAYFLDPALVFLMLADLVRGDREKRMVLRSLVIACIGVALWAAVQTVTGYGIPAPWNAPPAGIRATGPFPFPNALALFAVPIAATCLAFVPLGRTQDPSTSLMAGSGRRTLDAGRWTSILWIGFGSGLVATVLAKSVGGFLGILAAAFVALIWNRRTRRGAIVTACVAAAILLLVPDLRTPVVRDLSFQDWSGKVRLVMWGEATAMLKDRPIFGAGLGAYPDVIKPYHKATWMEIFQYPHDILLNLWSETGILGIVAFAWILILWWKRGGRLALPVIAAVVVHGLVDVPYFKNDLAILFWLLVAVTTMTSPKTEISTTVARP